MPIDSFPEGLQKVLSFLPGTYGTSLMRNHTMGGAIDALAEEGVPSQAIDNIKDALDCNIYFFDNKVEEPTMFIILGTSVVVLVAVYLLMNNIKRKKA